MASLVKMRCQTRELQKQHGKDIDQQQIGSQQMIQQEKTDEQENFNQVERVSGQGKKEQRVCMVNGKILAADKPLKDSADLRPKTNHQDRVVERNTSKKNARIKTLISPGSLGAYVRMKKNPRVQEQLSDGFPKKPIPVRNFSSLDKRMESSQKRQEQAEGKPPSLALMYMETHKRTPGKNYKTAEVNIEQIVYKDQELLGRCSKKVKGHSNSSVIIRDEFL
ncbi:hypothetical protein PHJA_002140200 [Phtheirospermum japonicum]|uniref:Uncharacterized protein n=1 Tax=Phtheirospermum japonicum TaxID=374723 RepID=A0A830D0T3_9LAMI|nr:hypothetical protein PHJA_002140200 [Phtheirospermum japonicum]